jgi:plastocyanin
MLLKRALPILMTVAILSLVACGSDDSETTSGEGATATTPTETAPGEDSTGNAPAPSGEAVRSARVEIVDFEYEPATVTIQAGGKVTWLNQDAEDHTATLDDGSFSTGDLAEGKLKSESFKTPGTYSYFCEIHPDMKGTVEVVE